MTEFDFDELDKAVNSVLGVDNSGEPADNSLNTNSIPITSESPEGPIVAAPASATSETSGRDEGAAVFKSPSRGRFMDIVPSAHSGQRQSPERVSRQGVTINAAPLAQTSDSQPISEPQKERPSVGVGILSNSINKVSTSDAADTPIVSEAEPEVVIGGDTSDHLGINDPIEMLSSDVESDVQAALEDSIQNNIEAPDEGEHSPIVEGVNVEKRPLGAFSEESAADHEVNLDENMSKAIDDALAGGDPAPLEVKEKHPETSQAPANVDLIPAELQSDIVAVEAMHIKSANVVEAAPAPQSNGAIKQQYTEEKPELKEDIVSPVFDANYQDGSIDKKNKPASKAKGVIVLIVMATLGLAAGAAVYYFDLLELL